MESIRETEARCRHFRSCRNTGACFRATAAEDTEANKGGCAKGRPNHLQRLAADSEKAWTFYNEVFGWQRVEAEAGEMSTYQLFSSRGQTMGGIVTKASIVPSARWLYYFNVSDIDSAAERVKTAGGQVFNGPVELPSGNTMVQCKDPQGAIFALRSKRAHSAIGYFKDADGRQWSW
jgi:uncharacterized protein